jgi:hypothetical protein
MQSLDLQGEIQRIRAQLHLAEGHREQRLEGQGGWRRVQGRRTGTTVQHCRKTQQASQSNNKKPGSLSAAG